jgi:hypothetical protein
LASTETLDNMAHGALACALVAQDGDAHAILIDSTKTAWRSAAAPFQLARLLGPDFKLVHLVRDPRAVAWSGVKKAGRRNARPLLPLRTASAAAGWWIANLSCELFGRTYPDRYIRLRYEDLARSPGDEMRDLLAKLASGAEWHAERVGANDNRHQLYGNRMRAANLTLAEVREDAAWQGDMPRPYRTLVSLLTAPLRKRYGYA